MTSKPFLISTRRTRRRIDPGTRPNLKSDMRLTTSFLGLALLLSACKRQDQPSSSGGSRGSTNLAGVWKSTVGFANGGAIETVITVAPDGQYVCSSSGRGSSNGNFRSEENTSELQSRLHL